jgi:hypothetical protein
MTRQELSYEHCEQGGPDSDAVKKDPYFNQWGDLDDSPIVWHISPVL